MKKIVWAVAGIVVLLFVLPLIFAKRSSQDNEPGTPAVAASPQITQWLDANCPNLEFDTYPKDIREVILVLSKLATAHHQFNLTFELDPKVQGTVTGRWINIPHRSFLDDMCRRHNWKWEVAGPNTIRISAQG